MAKKATEGQRSARRDAKHTARAMGERCFIIDRGHDVEPRYRIDVESMIACFGHADGDVVYCAWPNGWTMFCSGEPNQLAADSGMWEK